MRLLVLFALTAALTPCCRAADEIDSRVVRVRLANEDVEVRYVERAPVFTVELRATSASVEGVAFYVGNGDVAVELRAHRLNGIFFQGEKQPRGFTFRKGTKVNVLPGYKRGADLKPGTVYIELPGVTFEMPAKE